MLRKLLLIVSFSVFSCFAFADSFAEEQDSTLEEKKGTRLAPLETDSLPFLGRIKVSGSARMFAVYREMDQSYEDMQSADKNLEFSSYPLAGAGAANGTGQPFLDIKIEAAPTKNFEFGIGYALFHTFSGAPDSLSKTLNVRDLLNFNAKLNTDYGLFKLRAGGGVLWTSLSPLTLANPEYRPDNFDRLPWDWYTNSMKKYNDFFNASVNLGGESYGNIAMQGFQFSGDGLPYNFGFIAMYGRSNYSIQQALADFYPSQLVAGRLYNSLGDVVLGLNYYNQSGYYTTKSDIRDKREIITGDAEFNIDGMKAYVELGAGHLDVPNNDKGWGLASIVRFNIPESKSPLPLNIQLFSIDHNAVSNVSSSLNSNVNAPGGGAISNPDYQTTLFINPLQETGQVTNNRTGASISTGKSIGEQFHIEFALAVSQENKNIYDTITFQHKANAFSRSRFNPWVQTSGPYSRVKNIFRRSYEFISITDAQNGLSTDYRKGFSNIDLSLSFKTNIFGKQLILKNFSTYASIQEGVMWTFNEDAFLRQFYNQTIGFLELAKRVSFVAMYEMERNIANNRTTLSNYNRKPLDQNGYGIGVGLDYDFADYAGIYLRHRWMHHDDVNFVKDRFTGTETTIELKVFF